MHTIRETVTRTLVCPTCGGDVPLSTVDGLLITNPRVIAEPLMESMGGLEREELHVLLLTTRNRVIDDVTVYMGNVSAALVRVGELFAPAIGRHAAAIMLVHNHPSGDPTPSPDDLHLTTEAIAAGKLLDIPVLDHLIVSASAYVSLLSRGVDFPR